MSANSKLIETENIYLAHVNSVLSHTIKELDEELGIQVKAIYRHNKYMFQNFEDMDNADKSFLLFENELTQTLINQKQNYYNKLKNIEKSPYFGYIHFTDSEREYNVYIGLTYLLDCEENHLIYDWRAPICSMFYDFGIGPSYYYAPEGIINGSISVKRQYKIENGKIKYIFDNDLNINDDILQSVLSNNNDKKMKNIVNTIQQEQNSVIRNVDDNILIVQGVAGSGKTSVALHRIAFLLYKIKNLKNTDIVIFSPNKIFTEYISDVLPELGEENVIQLTYNDFLNTLLDNKYDIVEYDEFIESSHIDSTNYDLNCYKYSDQVINDLNCYINYLDKVSYFEYDVKIKKNLIRKEVINDLFNNRYKSLPLYKRINLISIYLSQKINGSEKGCSSIEKELLKSFKLGSNFKKLYLDFYTSDFCSYNISDKDLFKMKKRKIQFIDGILLVYLISKIKGFNSSKIKYVVIDEAQDYSKLQLEIIYRIFDKSNFTILGDKNQAINPYFSLKSLNDYSSIFEQNSLYIELLKTYRSTPEIINYSNKILGINDINSIRLSDNKPVLERIFSSNFAIDLKKDLEYLKSNYKKISIICNNLNECEYVYEILKNDFSIKLQNDSFIFSSDDILIIPTYLAKGLEFEAVIVCFSEEDKLDKNVFYVACTRAQHELIVYNHMEFNYE